MTRERLVVIGNGMAGLRFVEEIAKCAPNRFMITVLGAETEPAYNRVLLSPLLAGEIGLDDVAMRTRAWYAQNRVNLMTGVRALKIDTAERRVELSGGHKLRFDHLVLATGSQPFRLSLPGADLDGVMAFRTLTDVERMRAITGRGRPAVVIGGGLLGIEAAYGLARAGVPVTLVHIMDRLMERQLDAEAALRLKSAIEARRIKVILSAKSEAILGNRFVEGVRLADGSTIAARAVIMAAGIVPETALAKAAGLELGRAIKVDDRLQTSAPGIYAIGECAEHRGTCYGIVEPAYEQARVLAALLTGGGATYGGSVLATNLKVSGVPVFSVGDFEGLGAETIVLTDEATGVYRKLVVRDGRLVGAVLFGETTDALWYRDLVAGGASIEAIRPLLPFGRALAEAA
jgi:nitrite reductase (NADH) large subunit